MVTSYDPDLKKTEMYIYDKRMNNTQFRLNNSFRFQKLSWVTIFATRKYKRWLIIERAA